MNIARKSFNRSSLSTRRSSGLWRPPHTAASTAAPRHSNKSPVSSNDFSPGREKKRRIESHARCSRNCASRQMATDSRPSSGPSNCAGSATARSMSAISSGVICSCCSTAARIAFSNGAKSLLSGTWWNSSRISAVLILKDDETRNGIGQAQFETDFQNRSEPLKEIGPNISNSEQFG